MKLPSRERSRTTVAARSLSLSVGGGGCFRLCHGYEDARRTQILWMGFPFCLCAWSWPFHRASAPSGKAAGGMSPRGRSPAHDIEAPKSGIPRQLPDGTNVGFAAPIPFTATSASGQLPDGRQLDRPAGSGFVFPISRLFAGVGGRPSPCRYFLRRRRIDRRHRTQVPTRLLRAAFRAFPGLSRFKINSPYIALVALPGAMPELAVDHVTPVTTRSDSMVRRTDPV